MHYFYELMKITNYNSMKYIFPRYAKIKLSILTYTNLFMEYWKVNLFWLTRLGLNANNDG